MGGIGTSTQNYRLRTVGPRGTSLIVLSNPFILQVDELKHEQAYEAILEDVNLKKNFSCMILSFTS